MPAPAHSSKHGNLTIRGCSYSAVRACRCPTTSTMLWLWAETQLRSCELTERSIMMHGVELVLVSPSTSYRTESALGDRDRRAELGYGKCTADVGSERVKSSGHARRIDTDTDNRDAELEVGVDGRANDLFRQPL